MATHLIAFQIGDEESPEFRAQSARWLYDLLGDFPGKVNDNNDDMEIECWWHAADERFDRSDNDSAVFVTKGQEGNAYALLRDQQVSGQWNSIQHAQDPNLVAPHYDAPLTGEQRIAAIRNVLALAATYARRTGGRNMLEDIRAYEYLDDYVTDDEDISEADKDSGSAFEQVVDEYLSRPAPETITYVDDDNGEAVWQHYNDRLRDWYHDECTAREELV
jgi:hypothetical protein